MSKTAMRLCIGNIVMDTKRQRLYDYLGQNVGFAMFFRAKLRLSLDFEHCVEFC